MKRLAQFVRPCKTLVLYPLTWVVLALIMLTHLSFAWWFQPTPVMQSLAAVIDIFAVLLWGVLALQSTAWRALDSRMPYETTTRQVQKLLAECPAAFAIPARRCLELAQHISFPASRGPLITASRRIHRTCPSAKRSGSSVARAQGSDRVGN